MNAERKIKQNSRRKREENVTVLKIQFCLFIELELRHVQSCWIYSWLVRKKCAKNY